jgi:hypothetical protein
LGADVDEAPLAVERLRPFIALPDAQPQRARTGVSSLPINAAHQLLSNTSAVVLPIDIQPPQLDGRFTGDARWRDPPSELRVPHGLPVHLRKQRRNLRIGELAALLDRAVSPRQVEAQVSSIIVCRKRVPKSSRCQISKPIGICLHSRSNHDSHLAPT